MLLIRLFTLVVTFGTLLVVSFLSYRISKLLGHWEYGLLVFISLGYLWNISTCLTKKGLYNNRS